jgi:hypothetical protein
MAFPQTMLCREILAPDLDGVIALLTRGFHPERKQAHWTDVIGKLSVHPMPPGLPKYGYLLESDGEAVGVLLLIFSSVVVDGEARTRCNVSSWYVEPVFRSYAALLSLRATKHKHVTYLNITPGRHTWPMLQAQGYQRFSNGMFFAVPALCRSLFSAPVKAVSSDICPGQDLQPCEVELLLSHAGYGCLSLTCETRGSRHPFVFGRRSKFGSRSMPFAHLIYCRNLEEFVRFSGPLGRFLARQGIPLIAIASNGPLKALTGKYVDEQPQFFKGPERPCLGDIAYSERAMFGI